MEWFSSTHDASVYIQHVPFEWLFRSCFGVNYNVLRTVGMEQEHVEGVAGRLSEISTESQAEKA